MNEVELHVKTKDGFAKIDIDQKTNFPFNISFSDLENPSTTMCDYSAQISIPRTKNNNHIFNHIWKLDSTVGGGYNPLERVDFRLYVGQQIFKSGYIKLEEVNDNDYKIRLMGGLADYFYTLSEMKIKDLPFGDEFDHIINSANVKRSWEGRTENPLRNIDKNGVEKDDISGFFGYAMTYQGQYDNFDSDTVVNGFDPEPVTWKQGKKEYLAPNLNEHKRTGKTWDNIEYFGEYRSYYQKPMIKTSKLLEKIFEVMESKGFKTHPDETFFNEFNPYYAKHWLVLPNYDTKSDVSGVDLTIPDGMHNSIKFNSNDNTQYSGSWEIPINLNGEIDPEKGYEVTVRLPFYINAVYQDSRGLKDYVYRLIENLHISGFVKVGGQILSDDAKFKYVESPDGDNSEINLFQETVCGKRPRKFGTDFQYERRDSGDPLEKDSRSPDGSIYTMECKFRIEKNRFQVPPTSFVIHFDVRGNTWWIPHKHVSGSERRNYAMQMEIQRADAMIRISSDIGKGLRSGSTVGYKDIMRSEATCFDLVMSYCKPFGMIFKYDEVKRDVHIHTRNTYFSKLEVLDWTHKIDYSKESFVKPAPFNHRYGLFKYKPLNTKYEKDYLSKYGREYGSFRYDNNSGFSGVENGLLPDTIFENGIIATDYSQYYLGRTGVIYKDNKELLHLEDETGSSVQISFIPVLHNGFEPATNKRLIITDDGDGMLVNGYAWTDNETLPCSNYPRLKKVIEYGVGTYSLDFGNPSVSYNDSDQIGDNISIYPRFWHGYLEDRFDKDNKVFTAYVSLIPTDIYKDLLNKFILINNTIWVINKIINFNPVGNESTKVEFIRVRNPKAYVSQKFVDGNFIIRNSQNAVIYDSSGEAGSNSNPVVIRTDVTGKTIPLTFQSTLDWTITQVSNGASVSPISGSKGNTSVGISVPENDTGGITSYDVMVSFGSQTVIVRILMVGNWNVEASAQNGTALINGQPSPVSVPDGTGVTFTTSGNDGYVFSHWNINGANYYTQDVQMNIYDNTSAVAVWLSDSDFIRMYRNDEHQSTRLNSAVFTNNYWLLTDTQSYSILNERDDISGFDIVGIDKFLNVGDSFIASEDKTELTAIYNSLLINITVTNNSGTDFDLSKLKFYDPNNGEIAGLDGTITSGVSEIKKYRYDNGIYGQYKIQAQTEEGITVTISPESVNYSADSGVLDVDVLINSIGWEEKIIEVGYGQEEVQNKLSIPPGSTFVVHTNSGYVTASPFSGSEDSNITFVVQENTTEDDREFSILANISKGNDIVSQEYFIIRQVHIDCSISQNPIYVPKEGADGILLSTHPCPSEPADDSFTWDWGYLQWVSGSDGQDFLLYCTENDTGEDREHRIPILLGNGDIETIVVIQEG